MTMNAKWFYIILFIVCAVLIYRIAYALSKRIYAVIKINSLKKLCSARVKYLRCPILSLLFLSEKPDVLVEIGDTVYVIRLLSGIGGLHYMHFAREDFIVRYTKSRFHLGGRLRIGKRYHVVEHSGYVTTSNRSVIILPRLSEDEKYRKIGESGAAKSFYGEKKTVPILLLCPAPCELTYVTKEKTAIRVAFTGDEVFGQKIFTASSFVTHADRAARWENKTDEYEFSWED